MDRPTLDLAPALSRPRSRELQGALARLFRHFDRNGDAGLGVVRLHQTGTERPLGVVVANHADLCWATATGSATTLGDRIVEATGIARDRLEEHFVDGKTRGTPLGELLVSRGVLAGDELQRLLLEHIGSALGTLLRASLEEGARWSAWQPAAELAAPSSVFCPIQVVRAVLDQDVQLRMETEEPPEAFRRLLGRSREAVCYLVVDWDERLVLPVARSEHLSLSSRDLFRLFRSAAGTLVQPSLRALGVEPRLVWLEPNARGAWLEQAAHGKLVARQDDHLIVSHCPRTEFAILASGLRRGAVSEADGAGGDR